MSFYLELHCDFKVYGVTVDLLHHSCHTHRNDSVQGYASNTYKLRQAGANMENSALAAGWKKIGTKWACPGCKDKIAKI